MAKCVDAVFEGGGVKGTGLVGALSVVEAKGYTWGNLAGTSAGAIVAALAAAGYKAQELREILNALDYNKFKDQSALDKIPFVGGVASLLFEKGIYEGRFLEEWMSELLAKKGVKTFGDLHCPGQKEARYKYKLYCITSDISNEMLVVLPIGLKKYGINPDTFPVARAVRMSMSIPFFFEPVKMNSNFFVDGGILSNFPIWLFDSQGKPEWPTFGFKLVEPEFGKPNKITGPVDFAKAIITTMMDAHDKMHVENEDFCRTIAIPTLGVQTTEFDITPDRRQALYQSGVKAAQEFFRHWDFKDYIRRFRTKPNQSYKTRVNKMRRSLMA